MLGTVLGTRNYSGEISSKKSLFLWNIYSREGYKIQKIKREAKNLGRKMEGIIYQTLLILSPKYFLQLFKLKWMTAA